MKVLIINGSPKSKGNTAIAIREMIEVFDGEGIDTEVIHVGNKDIRGCIDCGRCPDLGKCSIDDIVNETAPKLEAADGVVLASPVYYSSPNGTLLAFLDRLFYSTPFDKRMKVGASVVCARRGGCSTTFDVLNKYLTYSGMPLASSKYWNDIHGETPGEADMDEEGKQTMRILAENMSFLMKCIAIGKEQVGLPQRQESIATNFIR